MQSSDKEDIGHVRFQDTLLLNHNLSTGRRVKANASRGIEDNKMRGRPCRDTLGICAPSTGASPFSDLVFYCHEGTQAPCRQILLGFQEKQKYCVCVCARVHVCVRGEREV